MRALAASVTGAPLLAGFAVMSAGVGFAEVAGVSSSSAAVSFALALMLAGAAVRRGAGSFLAALLAFAALGATAAATRPAPPPVRSGCGEGGQRWRTRVAYVAGRAIHAASGRVQRPVLLDLLAERCGDEWELRSGRVRARLWEGPAVARGDELELRLRVEPLPLRRNPTDPDPMLVARRDGVGGRASPRSPYVIVRPGSGLLAWVDRARDAASARMEHELGGTASILAKALSNGDQGAVGVEMREAWADSGLAHLLSVSGLHITLVATLIFLVATRLLALLPGFAERWSVRRAAALLAIPPVVLFCLWAGSPPPAVRSTVMGVALLAGIALGRPSAVLNAVGLAGILLLAAAPASLYDPGFLLSFVAILFLLLLPMAPAPDHGLWPRLRRATLGLVLASVVASLATAPITAHFFGRFSLVAPLANLVGVPLGSAVATPLALGYTLIAPLSSALARAIAVPLELTLALLDALARQAAALPFASMDVPAPAPLEACAFYAGLAALIVGPRRRAAQLLALAAALVIAGGASLRAALPADAGSLVVTHPYVGQGDATLVRFPSGAVMLVDAGGTYEKDGFDPGRSTLAPLLRRAGIRALDLVVVTHPHPDHLEGFSYLADHFPIHELWWSGEGEELPTMRKLAARVRARGGAVRTPLELPARMERDGVTLEILHPRPGPEAEGLTYFPELDANDNSVTLRLVLGRRSVLLPGDIEAEAEARLAPLLGRSDVLKSPHHGSRTSSTDALLGAVRPKVAVMSLGDHNQFGFPAPEVVARYEAYGAIVVRTDVDGLVEVRTDGERLTVRTASGRELSVD